MHLDGGHTREEDEEGWREEAGGRLDVADEAVGEEDGRDGGHSAHQPGDEDGSPVASVWAFDGVGDVLCLAVDFLEFVLQGLEAEFLLWFVEGSNPVEDSVQTCSVGLGSQGDSDEKGEEEAYGIS